jgi:hypothetical protein
MTTARRGPHLPARRADAVCHGNCGGILIPDRTALSWCRPSCQRVESMGDMDDCQGDRLAPLARHSLQGPKLPAIAFRKRVDSQSLESLILKLRVSYRARHLSKTRSTAQACQGRSPRGSPDFGQCRPTVNGFKSVRRIHNRHYGKSSPSCFITPDTKGTTSHNAVLCKPVKGRPV